MPRESPNAAENLPKEAPGQVTFGELEDEVPSVPNEAPAGLEQPLLETRKGPALNGYGQDEPAQQIAEVVGDHPEQQADLIGAEPVTGQARPVGGGLALSLAKTASAGSADLRPLLTRPEAAGDCRERRLGILWAPACPSE
jgi:hypothetical protein